MFDRSNSSRGNNGGYGRGSARNSNVYGRGRGMPRKTKEERAKLLCEHCGYNGHEMKECFKLHGYPDWYKELKDQQRTNQAVNMLEGSIESAPGKSKGEEENKKYEMPDFAAMIQKEIAKYLSGQPASTSGDIHSFSHMVDYSCIQINTHFALSLLHTLGKHNWIVDTGVSRHICSFPDLIAKPILMPNPVIVHLPDGSQVEVTHSGDLQLTDEITLTNVLIAPGFKYNLLSISQLLTGNKLQCVFSQNQCWLQDLNGGRLKAGGKGLVGLYILEASDIPAMDPAPDETVVHTPAMDPVHSHDMPGQLGRGKRVRHKPRWLDEYVTDFEDLDAPLHSNCSSTEAGLTVAQQRDTEQSSNVKKFLHSSNE
ncbi:hypothetical protein DH2020_018715 [Rehmannia glutinosa]|uniref:Retrovirus-related Pol polyprotein from transposon TNT 1-94-like beta-barrel domain-containing protein n=1 Tax=Rehmannia glutinosa TaxID=99300 RepID=A0ABR0WJR6_REHGL